MSTSTTAWVGTRKGLFRVDVVGGSPALGAPAFLGSPVTNAVADPRDGAVYASLDHGHFGVHLHRSDDGGESWNEIAAQHGNTADRAKWRLVGPMHLAETKEQAIKDVEYGIVPFSHYFTHVLPAGPTRGCSGSNGRRGPDK